MQISAQNMNMNKPFIISTTNSIEGSEVITYHGVLSERVVIGAGFVSEFFAGFTDIFGGRSGAFEARLRDLYEIGINKIEKSAIKKGANAIVGLKIDIDEISGKNSLMFMVTILGTAVTIKSNKPSEIISHNDSDNDQLIEISKYKVMESLEIIKNLRILKEEKKEDSLQKLINMNYFIPLNEWEIYFLPRSTTADFNSTLKDYLELYDTTVFNEFVNSILGTQNVLFESYKDIFLPLVSPDYQFALELIDKQGVDYFIKNYSEILLNYKSTYNEIDIEQISKLINKLNTIIDADVTTTTKTMMGVEVWVCSCGVKNSFANKTCSGCTRGKNGITINLYRDLKKTLIFLADLLVVLRDVLRVV